MSGFGTASEEELLLTKKLFWGIFDSLSHKVPPENHSAEVDVSRQAANRCRDPEIIYQLGEL